MKFACFSPLYLKIFEKSPFLMKTPSQNFAHHTKVEKHPFGVKTPNLATLSERRQHFLLKVRKLSRSSCKNHTIKCIQRILFKTKHHGYVNTYAFMKSWHGFTAWIRAKKLKRVTTKVCFAWKIIIRCLLK